MMNWVISVISGLFFRAGGVGAGELFCPMIPIRMPKFKLIMWFIGKLRNCIGILPAILYHNWLIALAYAVAVEIPYGDKSWIRKLVGRDLTWIIYGLAFGWCSLFSLSSGYFVIQLLLAGVSFWGLMKLSNDGITRMINDGDHARFKTWKLDQSYVEILFGFLGTIMYILK